MGTTLDRQLAASPLLSSGVHDVLDTLRTLRFSLPDTQALDIVELHPKRVAQVGS